MTSHHRLPRAATLFLVVTATVLAAACASKTVNEILADPARYRDRNVSIRGSVEQSYSFANRGVYRVDDGTGQLWIVSDRGVPRQGARVRVTGRIQEGFNIGSLGDRLPAGVGSGLVLIESSHRAD
jgi:hypothetical protein